MSPYTLATARAGRPGLQKYDRTALPVIDPLGRLVGIVTVDDVIDVAEEEATREIQRLGGLETLDEPYNTTPLLMMIRKRASWLVICSSANCSPRPPWPNSKTRFPGRGVALFVPLIL